MFNTILRPAAIALLCAALGFVFWLGATDYADDIQTDIAERTQLEVDKHKADIPDLTRSVNGREVKVSGTTSADFVRTSVGKSTRDVWGVRTLTNKITVVPKAYNLKAQHSFPNLLVLPRSPRIVETGIAAVTQLNPGELTVSDSQFVLKGTVFSEDRKRTVEQLIEVRRTEIEPLEIIVDITVESPGITQACRSGIERVLANNVLNYAVDHYKIKQNHLSVLEPMVDTIMGVCEGQIAKVLTEGHADYTGGVGYNQGLSERRSGTVRNYLIERGINAEMISAFGYGEFRPIASNESANGRARNRRTEIYLLLQDELTGNAVPAISLIEE